VSDQVLRARGNAFGVWEAAFGLVAGFFLATLAVSLYDAAAGPNHGQIGPDIVDFLGLWVGFLGAAFVASRTGGLGPGLLGPRRPEPEQARVAPLSFSDAFGLSFRWWDLPLGLIIGVGSQYALVPLLELPLQPFVHNLNQKLSKPANTLFGGAHASTAELLLLGLLVCIGSPLVEEIFFRGLLLRGLLGRFGQLGRRIGPALAIVITGVVFGLVHFEALQFLGLAGFGVLLSYVAYRTGRIGPTIVAHVAFNATTVIVYVYGH
jgi:uncharacterized protein